MSNISVQGAIASGTDAAAPWRAGLALILSTRSRPAGEGEVSEFIRVAAERSIDLSRLAMTLDGRKVLWALLPMPTSGGTLQILSPNVCAEQAQVEPAGRLIESVCAQYAARGCRLAQVLLDPDAIEVRTLYRLAGFMEMAELKYLHSPVRQGQTPPILPADFYFQTYSPGTHGLFAQAIRASYQQSLDCPALSGLRDIEDVILGHQAAGGGNGFDPTLWRVLLHRRPDGSALPCGVLLLCRVDAAESMELVYLGLAPPMRRRGLGRLLARQALASAAADHRRRLTLAVDSRNEPALNLYFRQGFQKVGAKTALIRNLAPPSQNAA